MKMKMRKKTNIYILVDLNVRGIKKVRYVGKAVGSVEDRFKRHVWAAKNGDRWHVCHWLRKIGFKAQVQLIEVVPAGRSWKVAEKKWIEYYKNLGCDLTNETNGGEGTSGYKRTKKRRKADSKRMLKWLKNHKHPAQGTRRTLSQASRKKMSIAQTKRFKNKPGPFSGHHHSRKAKDTLSKKQKKWCKINGNQFAGHRHTIKYKKDQAKQKKEWRKTHQLTIPLRTRLVMQKAQRAQHKARGHKVGKIKKIV
jgi:Uri superfamily endonuclease